MNKQEDNSLVMYTPNTFDDMLVDIEAYAKTNTYTMHQGGSSSSEGKQYRCYCDLPVRICTAKTPGNFGKRFLVCPNSLNPGPKCKFWEWFEEDGTKEVDVAVLKQEINMLKEEVDVLKKDVRKYRFKFSISCCK